MSATGSFYLQASDGGVREERRFDGTAVRVDAAESGSIPVPAPDLATP